MKDYTEGKLKYTVSQIEVDSTSEILKRKKEFLDELEASRKASGNLFNALLVTDITQLSSIMFLASDQTFEQVVNLPQQSEHVYYMKNIVSRKKQLIPLLTDLLSQVER
jgi:manganese-dependent inorganic pyrophosphatase